MLKLFLLHFEGCDKFHPMELAHTYAQPRVPFDLQCRRFRRPANSRGCKQLFWFLFFKQYSNVVLALTTLGYKRIMIAPENNMKYQYERSFPKRIVSASLYINTWQWLPTLHTKILIQNGCSYLSYSCRCASGNSVSQMEGL